MANGLDIFKATLILQLFYSFAITTLVYSLAGQGIIITQGFTDVGEQISLANTSTEIQDSLTTQTSIPIVDVGALVLYSGNILIDLLANFLFAVPQMITLLINGLMYLIGIDTYITNQIQVFTSVIVSAMYMIGLIQLLTTIRSGRVI